MTCYRFTISNPSDLLLKETKGKWNMSLGETIHSPCYHISNNDTSLNVVVLEYDVNSPDFPRPVSLEELMCVAKRSKLSFVCNMLENEKISDVMCYSTFHIDCKPWHHASAVIIGDAAHAYGPLTAKMANLAINDAYTLSVMLNKGVECKKELQQILEHWENIQRPKFSATRVRTYRHLEFYTPRIRGLVKILWALFPMAMQRYFGSIFAYDYEIYEPQKVKPNNGKVPGIIGVPHQDPIVCFFLNLLKSALFYLGIVLFLFCSIQ